MSIERGHITVSGLRVEVVRKGIKNLHLGVYPPHGRVRVAAPLAVSDDAVRLAVIGRLGWIKRQRARFESQPRQSARNGQRREPLFMGASLPFAGHPTAWGARIVLRNKTTLELHVQPEASAEQRERVLQRWYRRQLKELIPPLLEKWQTVLGVQVADWGVKKMKTKWGACNVAARRIWLNLELAKKPAQCLEYLVVHELVHLLERHHNDRFMAIMDKCLPQWRLHRQELNAAPLAHETWSY